MLSFGEAYGELKVFEDGEGVFCRAATNLQLVQQFISQYLRAIILD